MITCKICKKSVEKKHYKFDDLCEPCGLRTERTMYGIYIVCRGRADVPFEVKSVEEFIKNRSTKELFDLVGEIKTAKMRSL